MKQDPFATSAAVPVMSLAQVQALCVRCPFHRWLGLEVLRLDESGITLQMPWKEDIISTPENLAVHGGVLGALIDSAGAYAVAACVGSGLPTVDMRVDYHKTGRPGGPLTVHARVVSVGGTLATAEARVLDQDGKLVASGKGTYFVAAAIAKAKQQTR